MKSAAKSKNCVPSDSLTWKWKMVTWKTTFLYQQRVFHFHVSESECTTMYNKHERLPLAFQVLRVHFHVSGLEHVIVHGVLLPTPPYIYIYIGGPHTSMSVMYVSYLNFITLPTSLNPAVPGHGSPKGQELVELLARSGSARVCCSVCAVQGPTGCARFAQKAAARRSM